MAYKALIFSTDDIYKRFKPYYDAHVQLGTLEIVAHITFEDDNLRFVTERDESPSTELDFDVAILFSTYQFYRRMKQIVDLGIPRNRIIDGQVFRVPQLDFSRLLDEGVAYGTFENSSFIVSENSIYPSVLTVKDSRTIINLGKQNILAQFAVEDSGEIFTGNFVSIAGGVLFELGINRTHNFSNVTQYDMGRFGEMVDADFYPPWALEPCRINIGSDVWIGRGCILKCTNPKKPLVIGDGALVAADSVVVKNVPPYAIVGGNPAQIIKYRFEPEIVDALLRIKWWNWSLDKIHDNFKQFKDVAKFISIHDK